jgi:acetate kinase
MATLLRKEDAGDERAHLAIEMFCYRVRKQIGAYLAALGTLRAVAFGGGIGEQAPEIRRRICAPLAPLGIQIDDARNAALRGADGRFSVEDSVIEAWVIVTDEETVIARDTYSVLA